MRTLILIVLTTLALAACAKPIDVDPDVAEQPVPQFHMALNGDHITDIYNGASEYLRQDESLPDFMARLETVRRKMGPVQAANRQSWKAREASGAIFVTLTYRTTYAAGEAEEEFVVHMRDNTPMLAAYRIKAKALDAP
jgi:hypothetical protein